VLTLVKLDLNVGAHHQGSSSWVPDRSPVLLKQVCSKKGLWATTGDVLLRFLILNEFDVCSEITWITPHYVPNKGNFLCLEISFVLFTSKNSLATADRFGLIRWTPFIKLWISFLRIAFEKKNKQTNKSERPGLYLFYLLRCKLHNTISIIKQFIKNNVQ